LNALRAIAQDRHATGRYLLNWPAIKARGAFFGLSLIAAFVYLGLIKRRAAKADLAGSGVPAPLLYILWPVATMMCMQAKRFL